MYSSVPSHEHTGRFGKESTRIGGGGGGEKEKGEKRNGCLLVLCTLNVSLVVAVSVGSAAGSLFAEHFSGGRHPEATAA